LPKPTAHTHSREAQTAGKRGGSNRTDTKQRIAWLPFFIRALSSSARRQDRYAAVVTGPLPVPLCRSSPRCPWFTDDSPCGTRFQGRQHSAQHAPARESRVHRCTVSTLYFPTRQVPTGGDPSMHPGAQPLKENRHPTPRANDGTVLQRCFFLHSAGAPGTCSSGRSGSVPSAPHGANPASTVGAATASHWRRARTGRFRRSAIDTCCPCATSGHHPNAAHRYITRCSSSGCATSERQSFFKLQSFHTSKLVIASKALLRCPLNTLSH